MKYSIVIAAHDAEPTLGAAIESVFEQRSHDWELVVVDDGSTDGTAAVADAVSEDPRVVSVRQEHSGTATARNRGAELASGDYLVFLDADDMLLPDYLESQTAFIATHPGFDIYSCNGELLLPDGTRRVFWRDSRFGQPFSLSAEDQIEESSILLMAAITPRVLELTGGFRTLHSEDYDFWLRALLLGARHIYNPAVLAVYRRHEGQRTRFLVAEAESFLEIQRDALGLPGLTESQRQALTRAIEFSEARVCRRKLEENLLTGEYDSARSRYWKCRAAFPDKGKYVVGLVLMMASPRLYARIKAERMI